jgi:hypothetical protein
VTYTKGEIIMIKQKVYVQESYVYEYEMPTNMNAEEVEVYIKRIHPAHSVGKQSGAKPASVQYMVEDSEWTELHWDQRYIVSVNFDNGMKVTFEGTHNECTKFITTNCKNWALFDSKWHIEVEEI